MTQREKIINYLEKVAPRAVTIKRMCKALSVSNPVAVRIVGELRDSGEVESVDVLSSDGWLAFVWVGF